MSQGGYPGGLGGDLGGGGGYRGGYPKYPISWGVGGRGVYLPHYPGEGGSQFTPFPGEGGEGGVQGGYPKIPKLPVTEGGFPRYSGGGTLSLICLIRTFQKKGSR